MKDLSLENCRLEERYDVRRMLGRGSYAEIYLAEDRLAAPGAVHKQVVIKALNVFLHNDLDHDLERTLVENFQNEAVALDKVRHPNIISRLGHGTAQDLNGTVFHFLVLEYLSGGDLAKLCREEDIPLSRSLDMIEQVCAGLSNAHSRHVIHRDIKPQNLLLNGDHSVVKIADFGVARFAQSDAPVTRVGTNIYAPPEHSPSHAGMTGKLTSHGITAAADVYSLAKTAYVMLTSESPRFFSGKQITALPFSVRTRPWAEPFLAILRKATQDDPAGRHQTVEEFWKDIARLGEFSKESAALPSPYVTSPPKAAAVTGYSPNPPVQPQFDTTGELKLKKLDRSKRPGVGMGVIELPNAASPPAVPDDQPEFPERSDEAPEILNIPIESNRARSRTLRRIGLTLVFLILFSAAIFATYNLVLTRVTVPAFSSFFAKREAIALMNINLRPDASTDNPRIGLVTKGSVLKIIDSDGHWYRVEILSHGAPKTNPAYRDEGWISGKTRSGDATIEFREE